MARSRHGRLVPFGTTFVMAWLVVACSSSSTSAPTSAVSPTAGASTSATPTSAPVTQPPTPPAASAPSSTTASSTGGPAAGAALPDSPAGAQLRWILEQGRTASTDDVAAHLAPAAQAALPADKFLAVLQHLGALTVIHVDGGTPTALQALVRASDGSLLAASIAVEPADPHRIVTLLFRPPPPPPPASWADVDARLAKLSPSVSLAVVELAADGTPTPVHEVAPDQPHPLASAFKLYVLGALTNAIEAGTLAWDTPLAVTADVKSLPTGQLQDEPDGTIVTVQDAATKMISISDNTAADLIARAVGGSQAIAAVLTPMGMGAASRAKTLPFLTTRQAFVLKWAVDPALRDQYSSGDEAARAALLATLPTTLPPVSAVDPATPAEVDRIGWFASANELVAAQTFLDARQTDPALAPLASVLGTNPGVPLEPGTWPRFAYKGGSEPGVLTLSWLLQRNDSRRFAVALEAENTTAAVDESDAASIAIGVISLLANA